MICFIQGNIIQTLPCPAINGLYFVKTISIQFSIKIVGRFFSGSSCCLLCLPMIASPCCRSLALIRFSGFLQLLLADWDRKKSAMNCKFNVGSVLLFCNLYSHSMFCGGCLLTWMEKKQINSLHVTHDNWISCCPIRSFFDHLLQRRWLCSCFFVDSVIQKKLKIFSMLYSALLGHLNQLWAVGKVLNITYTQLRRAT